MCALAMPDSRNQKKGIPSLERRIAAHPKIGVNAYFSQGKLERIELEPSKEGFVCRFFGTNQEDAALLTFLKAYSSKKKAPLPDLDLSSLPPFTQKVLKKLTTFDFTEIASYGEVAKRVGSPRAARAVGNACRVNPFPLLIPCHRVLMSNGKLCGFAFGLPIKKTLLDFENPT